ncbi:hypothetical protein H8D04_01385 [bacterium]|nr:hypothetical protein [bacterium]
MKKIVINNCWGGFGLSEKAYDYLGLEWDGYGYKFSNERDSIKLVEVVEELGEDANGKHADLTVVEIPDDVDWEIYEYDGMEHVYDRNRVWGL